MGRDIGKACSFRGSWRSKDIGCGYGTSLIFNGCSRFISLIKCLSPRLQGRLVSFHLTLVYPILLIPFSILLAWRVQSLCLVLLQKILYVR